MAHHFEPLRVIHKPLAFYVAMQLVAASTDVVMLCLGFRRRKVNGMHCWVLQPKVPTQQASTDTQAWYKMAWARKPVAAANRSANLISHYLGILRSCVY